MRTLFDLGVRRDAWTPNMGGPMSMGQTDITDILKAAVTGTAGAATTYEQAKVEKDKAAAAAAQAVTSANQAKSATAIANATNPLIMGMTPTVFAITAVGVLGLIGVVVVVGTGKGKANGKGK